MPRFSVRLRAGGCSTCERTRMSACAYTSETVQDSLSEHESSEYPLNQNAHREPVLHVESVVILFMGHLLSLRHIQIYLLEIIL